jgi:tetratricopeptide (TPR) repeat protein
MTSRPTENVDAYQAYLRGRDLWTRPGFDVPRFERAAEHYRRAVELDPTFLLAWVDLVQTEAMLYQMTDEQAFARASKDAMDRAQSLAPLHPKTRLAVGYYHYIVERRYDDALVEFEAAVAELPNDSEVLQAMAFINRRKGNLPKAETYLRRALASDPQSAHVRSEMGKTVEAQRRFEEAEPWFVQAIALAPDEVQLYENRAGVAARLGDVGRARKILASAPGGAADDGMWVWLDWMSGDFASAERFARAKLGEGGRSPGEVAWWKLRLAVTCEALGRGPEARALFEQTRRFAQDGESAAPEDAERLTLLGLSSAALGRADEAIAAGKRAVELRAADQYGGPANLETLAGIYALVGRRDEAIALLARLLAMDYDEPLTPALLRADPFWKPLRDDPRFQALVR